MLKSARVQDASSPEGVGVRPKHLGRTGRPTRLFEAIEAAGSSLAAVARALGVTEGVVRFIASGERALTTERLDRMPRSVRRAYYELALLQLEEEEPASQVSPERSALQLAAAHGETAGALHEALADGHIDGDESASIVRKTLTEIACARKLARVVCKGST